MDDLVRRHLVYRLREKYDSDWDVADELCSEAADCIEEQDKRNKELEAALQFYKDGFRYHAKRTSTGINLSEWKPTEELLNDCGETARSALEEKK